jgi:hypothetical protein
VVSTGSSGVLADLRLEAAEAAANVLRNAGFTASTASVDVSLREYVEAQARQSTALGDVSGVIHAAGVSPSQTLPVTILAVALYGTALVLEACGNVVAKGGSAVAIASQSGHRLPALSAEEVRQLATSPTDDLLKLPLLQKVTDPLHPISFKASQLATREGRSSALGPA